MTIASFRLLLCLAGGIFAAEAGAAEQAAAEALARMHGAIRQLDYQGSFVYSRGAEVDALRIFHAGGAIERERLVGLNGAPSEVVRDGATVTCLQGGTTTSAFRGTDARLLPLLPTPRGVAAGNLYAVTAAGIDRVAGYRAHRIDVVPRDGYRYGYRLWLEDASGLPLRSAVVDANHRTLEEYMFVTLDIGAKPRDADLAASAATAGAPPAQEPATGTARWRVADPPPGFVLGRTHASADGVEHQLYSDGLANVSIYIEPHAGNERADQRLRRGMLGIYSHTSGGTRFTAIGDVPRATLERMVGSLKPAPGR
ncbi:MucB/RseB C-terminal domain-containing protein [Dokdonella sp.]|uniref:MucB/RseB C-terminal domain-containing protein n=1 Tax=Dokdonella sp. TaxID=2291710 RepID=UPI002F4130E2